METISCDSEGHMTAYIPRETSGMMIQNASNSPTEPTDFKMMPGTENIPDPRVAPTFSITADRRVTSLPSGLI